MLETRKVFIDTQSFVKAGLHFDGPAFTSFRKYCEESELIHVSTSVVEREVISKIELSVKEAISAIQTFRRKARVLSSLDDEKIKGLFEDISDEEIYIKSKNVFYDFMNDCSTKIIDAKKVNSEELLSLYFDKKPPFGDGKKKSEFPDAISILSLKSYLKDEEKIYIVSGDSDIKEYCDGDPNFVYVESIDKILDIYTHHTNIRYQQVKQYFIANEELIKKKVTDYLEKCEVYNSSSWEDAEVDGGLNVINIGDIDPSVLYINDEESQITFDIDVEFEVRVTGPDFTNGIYDREDGKIYTFENTSRTSIISTTFTVELFLYYEFNNGELANVEDDSLFIVGTSDGIEVSVEENEPYW